jgi:hypothetical protein
LEVEALRDDAIVESPTKGALELALEVGEERVH